VLILAAIISASLLQVTSFTRSSSTKCSQVFSLYSSPSCSQFGSTLGKWHKQTIPLLLSSSLWPKSIASKEQHLDSSAHGNGSRHERETTVSQAETDAGSDSIDEEQEVKQLMDNENRDVKKWRFVVLSSLIATSILVVYFTHLFLVKGETVDYENAVSVKCQYQYQYQYPLFSLST
jgi:hypothetical protein